MGASRGTFRAGVAVALLAVAWVLAGSGSTVDARRPRPSPTPSGSVTPTPLQVYGAWHCSDDYCTWGTVRSVEEFDQKNHWLIDRDPSAATGLPSVNVVVLSFVNPLKLLNLTNDATTAAGIPKGMTADIVDYFRSRGVLVMLSIGGITYVDDWNTALDTNGWQLGSNAADVAARLGVGFEIDYEENSNPRLAALEAFIRAYRARHPYAPGSSSSTNPAARLTMDSAAGDRWLIELNRKATADWLRTANQDPDVALDWLNAMVPSRQPSTSGAIANWQEHVDGKPQYAPPVLPLAPARFTGGLYVAEGSQVRPECNNFAASLQKSTGSFVQTVLPKPGYGTTPGMLGYMFWAAEKPSTRGVGTQPPNTCEAGIGAGASHYQIPLPFPTIRPS